MQKLVKEYLNELNRRHKRRRRVEVAVVLLVVIVASSVVGILTQYGFAMTEGAKCGHEEHQHGEECYQDVLVCGQEEGAKHQHSESCYQPSRALSCGQEESEGHRHGDGCYQSETSQVCGQEEGEEHQHSDGCYQTENVLVCGQEEHEGHQHGDACFQTENVLVCGQNEEEGHSHTDACHQQQMTCEKEEHVHTDWCWIDVNADVESASMWDAQYANVTWADSWGEDLVAAAQKQLGYKESVENYWIAEDGSHKGYTRYGQFVGDVYVNWDAAFVNFCLHYAGLEESGMFMDETDTARWHERFVLEKDNGYLVAARAYEPQAGDIVFFERQGEETAKQMGIVSSYDKERNEIKVIEGNSANEVKENTYAVSDGHIFSYLKTTEMERAHKHLDEMAGLENAGAEGGEVPAEPAADDENLSGPGTVDGENASESEKDGEEGPENSDKDGEENSIVELSTDVGDTTITLSGPASSFEEGKEYGIQAELIVNSGQKADGQKAGDGTDDGESAPGDERAEAIEEAVTKIAEEKEKEVSSYQAFDIKLMVDGEEVQPLGPVSVKFSSREVAEAVENEATEVGVIHVDENSGEVTDMEATATEEKDVVIETEHFSVYVYVNLENLSGKIKVTVQHWGEGIETLDGTADAVTGTDTAYDPEAGRVKTTTENCEIYSQDEITIPNEYYCNVEDLSKICKAYSDDEDTHYELTKVWVANNAKCLVGSEDERKTWLEDGTKQPMYMSYDVKSSDDGAASTEDSSTQEVKLTADTVIRFWYEPKQYEDVQFEDVPVQFYDYDISASKPNGNQLGDTNEQGINSPGNYPANTTKPKLQVGQATSGNGSQYVENASIDGKFLNKGNGGSGVAQGFVKDELQGGPNGALQFNESIAVPKNLFSVGEDGSIGIGSKACNGYSLRFKQNGDTYTLASVYKDGHVVSGMEDLTNFKPFEGWAPSGKPKPIRYSNFFWPLDGENGTDPKMGARNGQYTYKKWMTDSNSYHQSYNTPENDEKNGTEHNWFFGMTYTITFKVGDYTGPMEYYFRGDDDFWLFVDGHLVVDIGGIHSAIGHSVDLRKWMQERGLLNDPGATHTMKIFYMERGGTGSCCYMQFTLPKSEPIAITPPATTTYSVRKEWDDNDNPFRPEKVVVRLLQKPENGEAHPTAMVAELTKDNNWYYEWEGLPLQSGANGVSYGYSYSVEEISLPDGYEPILENGVLTNKLKPISVEVEKEWQNEGAEGAKFRPSEVKLALYADGKPYPCTDENGNTIYKTVTLNESNGWKATFDNLPQYRYEWPPKEEGQEENYNADAIEIVYGVRELDAAGNPIEDGQTGSFPSAQYKVQYATKPNGDAGTTGQDGVYKDTLVVTNTLLTDFRIVKVGSGESDESSNPLAGAVFLLTPCNSDGTPIEGAISERIVSNEKGMLLDVKTAGEIKLEQGKTYLLKEIEAPIGYTLSTMEWKISIGEDYKATVELRDGPDGQFVFKEPDDYEGKNDENQNVVCVYYFKNEVVYELPSTGGTGIYWYMFGGVLLMSAAALITYRNKHKGVLKS